VALVLIPQSVVFAQLVGVPPERGLYVAAFATLAAAPFASSPYLQTGPVGITALLALGATAGLATRGTEQHVGLITGAIALKQFLAEAQEAGLETRVEDIPPHAEGILARVLEDAPRRRRAPGGNGQARPTTGPAPSSR